MSQQVLHVVPIVLGGESHEALALFVNNLQVDSKLQHPFKHIKLVRLDRVKYGCLIEKINLIVVGSVFEEHFAGLKLPTRRCVKNSRLRVAVQIIDLNALITEKLDEFALSIPGCVK